MIADGAPRFPWSHVAFPLLAFRRRGVRHERGTLVPVEESREFVAKLREASDAPVLYAEMKGAQHTFDVLPTVRTVRVLRAIERFLAITYRERSADVEAELDRELTQA